MDRKNIYFQNSRKNKKKLDIITSIIPDYFLTEEQKYETVEREAKTGEKTTLYVDVCKAYIEVPFRTDVEEVTVEKEKVVDLRKFKKAKDDKKDLWYKVVLDDTTSSQCVAVKGWVKEKDLDKFSAYDWQKFGFKDLDAGNEYIYSVKDLREATDSADFVTEIWDKTIDTDGNKVLDILELIRAFSKPEIAQKLSRLVCKHKNEWSYTMDEIKPEVKELYDFGIQLEEVTAEKQKLETERDDSLAKMETKIENLMWWDEASKKPYTAPVKEEDKTKTSSTKRPSMLPEGTVVEEIPQKDVVPLDNKTTAAKPDAKPTKDSIPTTSTTAAPAPETKVEEKEVPPKRMFPSTDIVHHFHPIAWVEQMRLVFGEGGGDCESLIWGNKVSCEFRKRVIQISKRLECDPNHLMGAMALETGGKFDPKVDNGLGKDKDGIGYIGLIQLGNDAIKDMNRNYFLHRAKIKKKDLRAMSAVEQLCYVEYYLAKHKGKLKTLADFYLAILWPVAVGHGSEPNYIIFDDDSVGDKKTAYHSNPTFHREEDEYKKNSKGKIYKRHGKAGGKTYVWEIAEAIQEWYDKGVPEKNTSSTCTCNTDCSCGKGCIDLTGKVTWVSQYNKSELRKNKQGRLEMYTKACWKTSRKLLLNAGLGTDSGKNMSPIITALENKDHTSIALTTDAQSGVSYIDVQLEKGNPVLVGLNHTLSYGINDKTTDHFVVIVGRACENNKTYYRFYEVGTSWAHLGQHSNNKFFLGDDFSLRSYRKNKSEKYLVSQVRENF